MSTKTITLSEDAYEQLRALKEHNESFSEVVRRITTRGSLMGLAGLLTKQEALVVEKEIQKGRKLSLKRAKRIERAFS